jgi:hypothetical protein
VGGSDRADPDEDEWEEDELFLLDCQREGDLGDSGGDSGIDRLGPPLRMPSMTVGRVRPRTLHKQTRPFLFQVFDLPMRSMVMCMSAS